MKQLPFPGQVATEGQGREAEGYGEKDRQSPRTLRGGKLAASQSQAHAVCQEEQANGGEENESKSALHGKEQADGMSRVGPAKVGRDRQEEYSGQGEQDGTYPRVLQYPSCHDAPCFV